MAFGDLCFETYDTLCNVFNEPFAAVLKPFDAILGSGVEGLTIAVIWGIIIGVLWQKDHSHGYNEERLVHTRLLQAVLSNALIHIH